MPNTTKDINIDELLAMGNESPSVEPETAVEVPEINIDELLEGWEPTADNSATPYSEKGDDGQVKFIGAEDIKTHSTAEDAPATPIVPNIEAQKELERHKILAAKIAAETAALGEKTEDAAFKMPVVDLGLNAEDLGDPRKLVANSVKKQLEGIAMPKTSIFEAEYADFVEAIPTNNGEVRTPVDTNQMEQEAYSDLMRDTPKVPKKEALLSKATIRSYFPKDKNGAYLLPNGKKINSDALFEEYVNNFYEQYNHPTLMKEDDNYRKNYFLRNFHTTEEEFVRDFAKNMTARLDKIEADYADYVDKLWTDERMKQDAWRDLTREYTPMRKEDPLRRAINDARKIINSAEKDNYWRGFAETFSWEDIASYGMSGISSAVDELTALNKYIEGKPLNDQEKLYIDLSMLKQEVAEFRSAYNDRGTFSWNRVGNIVGHMPQFMFELGLTGTAFSTIGKKAAKEITFKAVRDAMKQSTSEGLKMAGKKLGYSVIQDALATPTMAMSYKNLADRRLRHYSWEDSQLLKQEAPLLLDYAKALGETFVERHSEAIGLWVTEGMVYGGKVLAQAKFLDNTFGKTLRKVANVKVPETVSNIRKTFRIGGYTGEVGSEIYNNLISPLFTGETEAWRQLCTDEYYWELMVSMAIPGAAHYALAVPSYVRHFRDLKNLQKSTSDLLSKISNQELKELLIDVMSSDKLEAGISKLTAIDWNNVSAADAQAANRYIFDSVQMKLMQAEELETERLNAFMPLVENVSSSLYSGKNATTPTLGTELHIAQLKDGKEAFIIHGDMNDTGSTTVVARNELGETVAINKSDIEDVKVVDMSNYIAEQYSLLFSDSANKEKIANVISDIRTARQNNASNDTFNQIINNAGFVFFNVGEQVTLTDGSTWVVQDHKSGYYKVAPTADSTDSVWVGFLNVLQPNQEIADAQQELANQIEESDKADTNADVYTSESSILQQSLQKKAQEMAMQDGQTIYTIRLSDGREAFVKQGNIVQNEDGSIDTDSSDATLVIKAVDSADLQQISIEDVEEVIETTTTSEVVAAAQTNIEEQIAKKNLITSIFEQYGVVDVILINGQEGKIVELIDGTTYGFIFVGQDNEVHSTAISLDYIAEVLPPQDPTTPEDTNGGKGSDTTAISAPEGTAPKQGIVNIEEVDWDSLSAEDYLNIHIMEYGPAQTLGLTRGYWKAIRKTLKDALAKVAAQDGVIASLKARFASLTGPAETLQLRKEVAEAEAERARLAVEATRIEHQMQKYEYAINKLGVDTTEELVLITQREQLEAEQQKQDLDEAAKAEIDKQIAENAIAQTAFDEKVQRRVDELNGKDVPTVEEVTKPSLMDVVKTLYTRGKEVASKLFSQTFFNVAQTPQYIKDLGLNGDRFTIRYGVIARHFGKDAEHTFSPQIWEQLPEALQHPFAITKYYKDENKQQQKGYRLYTTLRLDNGSYIVVGAEVKNSGRDIEVNSINTIFGRNSISEVHDELIYVSKNITPEQQSLLNGNNPHQYPDAKELSTDKDTINIPENQENQQESLEDSTSAMIVDESSAPQGVDKAKWDAVVDHLEEIVGAENVITDTDQMREVLDYLLDEEGYQNGNAAFSMRTYAEEGRQKLVDYVNSRVENSLLTEAEAADIVQQMDDIYNICQEYKDKYAPFGEWSDAAVVRDEEGKPVFSVIKKNGEYAMNLDFSLVCKKRRTLDAVFRRMIDRGIISNYELGQVDVAKINDIIRRFGFETACRLCFVDAKRFRVAQVADVFCEMYNPLTDLNDEQLRAVITEEGNTTRGKIAKMLIEHPENRVKLSRANFMESKGFENMTVNKEAIMKLYNMKKGTGGPKASYGDTQYVNDILDKQWTPEAAYEVGGVRLQSFSDYVPRMVFDYIQMVADLAAKGLPVHAYTKEVLFAQTFGLTGIKINLSLVPKVVEGGIAPGLDAEGNYVWQEGETFPYEEAIALQNAEGYKENCGTIAVGVSDAHIAKLLDDENIRMVIPYHKSGLNKAVAIHNNIDQFTDYTNEQNTRRADGTKLSKEQAKAHFNFNAKFRKSGNARAAADAYLKWCDKKGYIPKFDQFRNHPNYYKLLEDFTTCVTENGVDTFIPQQPVQMHFPTEQSAFGSLATLIEKGLEEDAVLEGQRNSQLDNIVDAIENELGDKVVEAVEDADLSSFRKMKTSKGEVYGFTYNGKIYLDPTTLNLEAPVHEYTELWCSVIEKQNPALWAKGVELLKQTNTWEVVNSDPNYRNLSEDLRASETLSRIVAAEAAKKISEVSDSKTLIAKLRAWIRKFWNELKATFSQWTKEDISKLTLREFKAMPFRDLIEGVDPRKYQVEGGNALAASVDVVGDNSLVAIHNISGSKLAKALKQGGLANPSAAVIDIAKQSHEGYGEYSFILPKNLVAKKSGKNLGTYDRDAWTPLYPTVIYSHNKTSKANLNKLVEGLDEGLADKIKREVMMKVEGNGYYSGLQIVFLKDKGVEVPIATVTPRYAGTIEDLQSLFGDKEVTYDNYKALDQDAKNAVTIWIKARGNKADIERINGLMEQWSHNPKLIKSYTEEVGYGQFDNLLYGLQADARNSGNPDYGKTIENAVEYIRENNLQEEFDVWETAVISNLGFDEKIQVGWSPSGDRIMRKNTLENVSAYMRKQGKNASSDHWSNSEGKMLAKLAQNFATLEQIRANKHRLLSDVDSTMEIRRRMNQAAQIFMDFSKNSNLFLEEQSAYAYLEDILIGGMNPDKVVAEYNKATKRNISLTEEQKAELKELREDMNNIPVQYFETKFDRPVMFSEFAAVVAPNNMPEVIENQLREVGLNIYKYDPDVEGDRREQTLKATASDSIRFMFVGEKGAAAMDAVEEASVRLDNLAVAREMESAGKDAKSIKLATGWERGADRMWRYEVPDIEINQDAKLVEDGEDVSTTLGSLVESSDLFAAYPELRDVEVTFTELPMGHNGSYLREVDGGKPEITLSSNFIEEYENPAWADEMRRLRFNPLVREWYKAAEAEPFNADNFDKAERALRRNPIGDQFYALQKGTGEIPRYLKKITGEGTLAHEIQHIIQEKEGFAQGGTTTGLNTRLSDRLNELTEQINQLRAEGRNAEADEIIKNNRGLAEAVINNDADVLGNYKKLAGEVEARNVAARLNMTPEQRRETLAAETADVAPEDQIFLYNSMESSNILDIFNSERRDIEKRAKADGTWLKAPNGKDTNLTPEQWVTVRSRAFKGWAGDWINDPENATKVLDQNGEPMPVHHGTVRDGLTKFNVFDTTKPAWFAKYKDYAQRYNRASGLFKFSDLYTVFLDIRDPLVIPSVNYSFLLGDEVEQIKKGFENTRIPLSEIEALIEEMKPAELWQMTNSEQFKKLAEKYGYDGIFTQEGPANFTYATFKSAQVKSVNNRAFDSENDDIRFMVEGSETDSASPRAPRRSKVEKLQDKITALRNELHDNKKSLKDVLYRVYEFLTSADVLNAMETGVGKTQYRSVLKAITTAIEQSYGKKDMDVVRQIVDKYLWQAEDIMARVLAHRRLNEITQILNTTVEGYTPQGVRVGKRIDEKTRNTFKAIRDAIAESFVEQTEETDNGARRKPVKYRLRNRTEDGDIATSYRLQTTGRIANITQQVDDIIADNADNTSATAIQVSANLVYIANVLTSYDATLELNEQIGTVSEEIDELETKIQQATAAHRAAAPGSAEKVQLWNDLKAFRYAKEAAIQNRANLRKSYAARLKTFTETLKELVELGVANLKNAEVDKIEKEIAWKVGIYRSIKDPEAKVLPFKEYDEKGKKRNSFMNAIKARSINAVRQRLTTGNYFLATFDMLSKEIDRASIPGHWLEDGWYYQFMLSDDGYMCRADWRHNEEQRIQKLMEDKTKEIFERSSLWSKIKAQSFNLLNIVAYEAQKESGFKISELAIKTDKDGKIVGGVQRSVPLTIGNLLYIRNIVRQQGGKAGYVTWGISEEQLDQMVAYVEQKYPEYCQFSDWVVRELIPQLYEQQDAIYFERFGTHLTKTHDYFPIVRDKRFVGKIAEVGEGEVSMPSSVTGNIVERVKTSAKIDLTADMFTVLRNHIKETLDWIAYSELTRRFNSMSTSRAFRNRMDAQGFPLDQLKQTYEIAIGQGAIDKDSDTFTKAVNSVSKSIVAGNLVFNFNAAIKQLISMTAVLGYTANPKFTLIWAKNYFTPAVVKLGVNKAIQMLKEGTLKPEEALDAKVFFDNWNWALENIPTLRARWESRQAGFEIFKAEGLARWDKVSNYITRIGLAPNAFVDMLTCANGARAIYEYQYAENIKNGMSEEKAHKDARVKAAVFINETQQSGLSAFTSPFQSGGVIARMFGVGFGAYQNTAMSFSRNEWYSFSQIFRMMNKDNRTRMIDFKTEEYRNQGVEYGEARKRAQKEFKIAFWSEANEFLHNAIFSNFAWVLGGYLSSIIGAAFGSMGFDDDEWWWNSDSWNKFWSNEDTRRTFADIISWSTILYQFPLFYNHPLAKQIMNAYQAHRKGTNYGGIFDSPVSSDLDDLIEAISKQWSGVVDPITGEVKKYETIRTEQTVEHIVWAFLLKTGLTLNQRVIKNISDGIKGMIEDGVDVEDIMNFLSSPRSLTRSIAGEPRKGETTEQYLDRMSYVYRLINEGSGIYDSKWQRERIDEYVRKRERPLYEAMGIDPLDAQALEAHKKAIEKILLLRRAGNLSKVKEGKADEFVGLSPKAKEVHIEMYRLKRLIDAKELQLKYMVEFDDERAALLKEKYKLEQDLYNKWKEYIKL